MRINLILLSSLFFYSAHAQKVLQFGTHTMPYQRINDTLYIGTYEVGHADYRLFLSSLSTAERNLFAIDSSQWLSKFPSDSFGVMVKNYHRHEAFNIYPVVNISHLAATRYCLWLTENYGKAYSNMQVTFRLPSAAEWRAAANINPSTGLPYKLGDGLIRKKGETFGWYKFNIKTMDGDSATYSKTDGGYFMVFRDAYWPTDHNLYNMIGNVCEMLINEGEQIGCSWYEPVAEVQTGNLQHYATPDPRVGFRVVAIVSRKK